MAFKKPDSQLVSTPNVVAPILKLTPTTTLVIKTENKVAVTETIVPTKAPVADNRCIIAVDSVQYDITRFRNQHSGGDIFQCGTDMSSIFHGQHDNSFIAKMAPYKI